MFIISLSYVKPLEDVEAHLEAHVDYLKRFYGSGEFLASGRKVPRTGGVIFAVAESRERIEEIVRQDPFHENGVAEFEITEFAPTMTAQELEFIKGK